MITMDFPFKINMCHIVVKSLVRNFAKLEGFEASCYAEKLC